MLTAFPVDHAHFGNLSVNQSMLRLVKRQLELETAIRQKGGFRIVEEQELRALRQRLAEYPEAIRAVLQASHALRRPVSDIGPHDVESWAKAASNG
jgi:hypothetical protein